MRWLRWCSIFLLCLVVLAHSGVVCTATEVDRGSNGRTSITDEIQDFSKTNKPDQKKMDKYVPAITRVAGTITSFIIYIIFAFLGFSTACDLVYMAVPFLRSYMYQGSEQSQGGTGMQAGQGSHEKKACWISDDLKYLIRTKQMRPLAYIKRRAVSLIIIVVVIIVLCMSTVISDFGVNIGEFIFDYCSKVLGF